MEKTSDSPNKFTFRLITALALVFFGIGTFSGVFIWKPEYGVKTYLDKIQAAVSFAGTFAFILFCALNLGSWRRCLRSYRAELTKAQKFIHVYVTMAIMILGALVVVYAGNSFSLSFNVAGQLANGYSYAIMSIYIMALVLQFFVVVFTCNLVASENASGTLTTCLIRPIKRWEFLAGKVLAILTFIFACLLICAFSAFAFSGTLHDFGAITVDGFVTVPTPEIYKSLAIFIGLNAVMLMAVAATALFISLLCPNTGSAIFFSLTIMFMLLGADIFLTSTDTNIFMATSKDAATKALNMAAGVTYYWLPKSLGLLYASLSCIYVVLALASYVFSRQDIHSRN